jgi:hypothetical protein
VVENQYLTVIGSPNVHQGCGDRPIIETRRGGKIGKAEKAETARVGHRRSQGQWCGSLLLLAHGASRARTVERSRKPGFAVWIPGSGAFS